MAKDFRIIRDGGKIVLKENVPDRDITPKFILEQIKGINDAIQKSKDAIEQAYRNIPIYQDTIEQNEKTLKEFKHHEAWALEVQHSKAKMLIDELKDEIYLKVQVEYKMDPVLTDEQNDLQKFMLYQKYLSTHPKVAAELAAEIMMQDFYTDCIIENPWKKK